MGKHQQTLRRIFGDGANIHWRDIEALLTKLGGEITEGNGSRMHVFLFGEIRSFHRPHPSPDAKRIVVGRIKNWLREHGIDERTKI